MVQGYAGIVGIHRNIEGQAVTAKTHPDFIPPWQDMPTLCAHICATPNTVDTWVVKGILPPPRKRGGKLMWKWAEVDQYLTAGKAGEGPVSEADRIRDATQRAAAERHAGH